MLQTWFFIDLSLTFLPRTKREEWIYNVLERLSFHVTVFRYVEKIIGLNINI